MMVFSLRQRFNQAKESSVTQADSGGNERAIATAANRLPRRCLPEPAASAGFG
jgi:hypothetical protein